MRVRIIIDVDLSETLAATMQRSGFTVCPDGSKMQIKIQNSPAVPSRKVKIEYKQDFVDTSDLAQVEASK